MYLGKQIGENDSEVLHGAYKMHIREHTFKSHDLTCSMALCYYDSVIPKVLNTLSTHKKDPEVLHSANKMHIREYPFKRPQHTQYDFIILQM